MRVQKGSGMMIDIYGLSAASVIAALFNAANAPRRAGVIQLASGPLVMDEAWAEKLIKEGRAFSPLHPSDAFVDYLHGRAIKVDLSNELVFDPRQFDENQGKPGLAKKAIDHLRRTGEVVIIPDHDAHAWLRIVTDESLELFDTGGKMDAIANFIVGVARHPDTAHIPSLSMTVPFLMTGADDGRKELERVMIGFSA